DAAKVARLNATLTSRAAGRCPTSASTTPPSSGKASTSVSTGISLVLQLFEVADVQAVELLADLEHEHAQDQHADQHVERDAEFHHHRHAVGGRGGGEEQAVSHRQESEHL